MNKRIMKKQIKKLQEENVKLKEVINKIKIRLI